MRAVILRRRKRVEAEELGEESTEEEVESMWSILEELKRRRKLGGAC